MHTNQKFSSQPGFVIWVTGLAGAGKTTLAQALYTALKPQYPALVLLDGDTLREILGQTTSYDLAERQALALRYSKLCHLLSNQGISVIIATISLFHQIQAWNRKELEIYREIFLDPPLDVLHSRDQKELYSHATQGKNQQVMGIGLQAEFPQTPDLHLTEVLPPKDTLKWALQGLNLP